MSSKQRPMAQRQDTAAGLPPRTFSPMQYISVDRVLRHATEIPSGQPRIPPAQQLQQQFQQQLQQQQQQVQGQNQQQTGTMAAVRAAARAATRRTMSANGGGLVPPPTVGSSASRISAPQNIPQRTTKVSEKLVLIPDAPDEDEIEDDDAAVLDGEDGRARRRLMEGEEEDRPLRDVELDVLKKRGGIRGKSYAERLPKRQRAEKVSRLTAYCTAQGFKMKATADFLRTKHEAKTKLYDDCLYVVYHLPLTPGVEGYRVRSRPILKSPGTGKTVLDLEIERSERRDEHYGYDEYSASPTSPTSLHSISGNGSEARGRRRRGSSQGEEHASLSPINRLAPDAKNFAEMFVFSYGVVVFWNFTEGQEKDILGDLTFAESEKGTSLVTRPFDPNDYETEEFHFEYSANIKHPRIFNDMITLLPRSDHMVKLSISHAVAQSTKLCSFEERMSETMQEAEHVPKRLALTGDLNMGRTEIVKVLGRLFKSRVDINLSSNILPVPNFFWDSEPTLHPLYMAIRDYLEIDPRIKVLNERCRVFLDLAEILSDTVADAKMSAITWIIIVLIVISIIVTVTEVGLRFGILQKSNSGRGGDNNRIGDGGGGGQGEGEGGAAGSSNSRVVELGGGGGGGGLYRPGSIEWRLAKANITVDELRQWSAGLSERERGYVCGGEIIGQTFAGV